MINEPDEVLIEKYKDYLNARDFPCVAARAAVSREQVHCMVAGHMACSVDDTSILKFLYQFIDDYRNSKEQFHSASIIFRSPESVSEDKFDALLWQRLQSLSDLDAKNYSYDKRVNSNLSSPDFSFSIKEEAFFIIGLHPLSSRLARRFKYPTLAFNPHAQFEYLRSSNNYGKLKNIVRRRDIAYSGSINPMLDDFGESSEVYQYSGKVYDNQWQCPLHPNYDYIKNNSSS
jgi:FPC/CPF motif-containing protein YcgG